MINEMNNETEIYSYTREDAIDDGILVDISNTDEVKELGFKIPVAITSGVDNLCQVPENLKGFQDYKGRLWDVLWMATTFYKAKKRSGTDENELRLVEFQVYFQMTEKQKKLVTLWLVFNEYEGFTIMLPDEY